METTDIVDGNYTFSMVCDEKPKIVDTINVHIEGPDGKVLFDGGIFNSNLSLDVGESLVFTLTCHEKVVWQGEPEFMEALDPDVDIDQQPNISILNENLHTKPGKLINNVLADSVIW